MKNCPNCGALIGEGQDTCSICNARIVNETKPLDTQKDNIQESDGVFIYNINAEEPIKNVYEPLPTEDKEENVTQEEKKEETTTSNTSSKPTDEEKKNVMSDILKEHEEKNKKVKKDDSYKGAIFSIIAVIVIVVGGYYAVKLGFTHISDGKDHILESVVTQSNDFTKVIENYMSKYDYKEKKINLNGYYAKSRTNPFLSLPLTGKCAYVDGKWSGADNDEISCEKFFTDIYDNYCSTSSTTCDIPTSAEFYIKEKYETVQINGNEETITSGSILDGTTLTYDDVKCSLSGGKYTCEYIEKQE